MEEHRHCISCGKMLNGDKRMCDACRDYIDFKTEFITAGLGIRLNENGRK